MNEKQSQVFEDMTDEYFKKWNMIQFFSSPSRYAVTFYHDFCGEKNDEQDVSKKVFTYAIPNYVSLSLSLFDVFSIDIY